MRAGIEWVATPLIENAVEPAFKPVSAKPCWADRLVQRFGNDLTHLFPLPIR